MALLDGLAGILQAAVAPLYRDGTLLRQTEQQDDGSGTLIEADANQEPIKVQREACTDAMRRADGYSDTDVRLLILATIPRPSTDDQVELEGVLWSLASVDSDPAGSYFDCRGKRISGA